MLKEILTISNYPSLQNNRPFTGKLLLLLQIYGILFLLNMLIAPIGYFADLFVTHVMHYKSIRAQYSHSMLKFFKSYGLVKAFLYICIAAPVLEESIFRLPLTFKRQHIALALAFALVLAVKLVPGLSQQSLWINILVRLVLFGAGYLLFNKLLPQFAAPGNRLQTRLIITSIVIFGLMHIFNYAPLQWNVIYIYPLFVIPQLIMGLFITYMRFKKTVFFWGMALHALVNTISMVLYTLYRQ